MSLRKQLFFSLGLIVLVIATGTVGYSALEGWGLLDALYMTVITITTIGFEEVHPLTTSGRVFTVILILFSVGAVFYALNYATRILLEGELRDSFGRRKLDKALKKLKDHYIVCGYGRMGRIICKELTASEMPFVVIEREVQDGVVKPGGTLVLKGDATRDEVLREAGIERASGLISVLPSDAENLYVVLSARGLAPSLNIVARAVDEGSEKKLLRAGANRAVSPYHIGALRIAHMLLTPTVVDFIELTTQLGSIDLHIEELPVTVGSSLCGRTIEDCGISRELGVIVVAIKSSEGQMQITPPHKHIINPGETLVVIGEVLKLRALEEMAGRS